MSRAVGELEKLEGLEVIQALRGSLNNAGQCLACGCPTGAKFIVLVRTEAASVDQISNWNKIDPSSIVSEDGDFDVLPVLDLQ